MAKKSEEMIRSSAAEYLTYVAAAGEGDETMELRYQDENIWLTQKMMAELYGVSVSAVNQHLKKIFEDGELLEEAVILVLQRHSAEPLATPRGGAWGTGPPPTT